MTKSAAIDPNVPAGSEDPKLGDNRIRTLAAAVAELLGVNHYMGSDGGAGTGYSEDAAGEHETITLRVASAPTVAADKGYLYAKDVGGKAELHYRDEDGNQIQITSVGKIPTASIQNSAFMPSGAVIPYGGLSAPTGWLLCDGSAVSRITYATLFGVIGTGYGSGDSSTTFNVPDMRGRVPVGLDAANAHLAAADTLGETGGEETHILTSGEMPAHVHSISTKQDDHSSPKNKAAMGDASTAVSSYDTDSTGGGGSHNNLQPYNTVNYIIKT